MERLLPEPAPVGRWELARLRGSHVAMGCLFPPLALELMKGTQPPSRGEGGVVRQGLGLCPSSPTSPQTAPWYLPPWSPGNTFTTYHMVIPYFSQRRKSVSFALDPRLTCEIFI